MTADILIAIALTAALLAFALSWLLRQLKRWSRPLISAPSDSAPVATKDEELHPEQAENFAQAEAATERTPEAEIGSPPVAKDAAPSSTTTAKAAETAPLIRTAKPTAGKPTPADESNFLPTLAPPPVTANSARASVPAPATAPKFVVKSLLKSELPAPLSQMFASAPESESESKQKPADKLTTSSPSESVVDMAASVSPHTAQDSSPALPALPETLRKALARLNRRFDQLEESVHKLEVQLNNFELDFSHLAGARQQPSTADAASDGLSKSESEPGKSDSKGKTIAA